MAGVAYICVSGCLAECSHGEPCGVFRVDDEHPHPSKRGHEQHFGYDEANLMHEWIGAHGQCKTYPPPKEWE